MKEYILEISRKYTLNEYALSFRFYDREEMFSFIDTFSKRVENDVTFSISTVDAKEN